MTVELSDFQRGNLRLVARELWDFPQSAFCMRYFDADDPLQANFKARACGSVGCVLGHSPGLGIAVLHPESWTQYSKRVFGLSYEMAEWDWCFSHQWAVPDNTPRGAAKRILYFLRHGLPEDSERQQIGDAPLCYLDEQLDESPVSPALPLACVEACFSEALAK